ncbi:MAG: hypothetical protein MJZ20_09490 [Bacteroidaceae bacterium]|nr:hypothetical protein [Bacteroidaceae bacterium]
MAEVRIALYRMNDNPNTCGKFMGNIKTTFVARVRGVFRGPFNVIAPTLELIRGISDSTDSSYEYDWYTEVNNFNYACIENAATVNPTVATKPAPSSAQECPRYYFVQNVTVDPMGRIIVSLLEDVLETYKTSIKNLTCFIERSENHYNKRIPDGFATALPGYK